MNRKKVTTSVVGVLAVMGLAVALFSDRDQVIADELTTSDGVMLGDNLETATFAGGCFWCVEKDFELLPGVAEAVSGYTGGEIENPTYKQVSRGQTKHTEAVMVHYDPNVISYEKLLQAFWRQVNPTDLNGQYVDRGQHYRPAIFVHNEQQAAAAEASKQALIESNRYEDPVIIPIQSAGEFYDAEEYHQDFYKKSPGRYKTYRYGSGRDQYLSKIWGDDLKLDLSAEKKKLEMLKKEQSQSTQPKEAFVKPSDAELREQLSEIAYKVTQKDATEPPFNNAYNDEKRPGIYVDVVSGEPLFSSLDKFDSGTGWPSFVKPLEETNVKTKTDYKLILPRTEVRSAQADSHLGHVFKDGPAPTGLRYCMNSAAMRFIPKEDLEREGYSQYVELFDS